MRSSQLTEWFGYMTQRDVDILFKLFSYAINHPEA